jgi:dGTPase
MLDWNKLISGKRVADSSGALKDSYDAGDRSPFQIDYDRVIFSEPFRRLGRKTQVHPLVPNDHVRNRLTHSLEVASAGRSFGSLLWQHLNKAGPTPSGVEKDDICQILQTACLAHDIGNPPFGHAGEYAIRAWSKENKEVITGEGNPFKISNATIADWEIFEGNAQGFRLASRSDIPLFAYMNLTVSSLAAMVKYPFGAEHATEKGKYNFLSAESQIFDAVFAELGLKHDGKFIRHPLSFLSEAADDLCYRIADLEDAVRMNILDELRVREIFASVCGEAIEAEPIGRLRARAVGCFIAAFWKEFVNDYDAIMRGDRKKDLKESVKENNLRLKQALKEIGVCYEEIFAHRFKVATEYGAYNTLGRIIEAMCLSCRKMVSLTAEKNQQPSEVFSKELDFRSQRCLELSFGSKFAIENLDQDYAWWLHSILDFVSSLTDNYTKQLSSEIAGF